MSVFKAALGICGFSQGEAAEFLGMSPSSIDKMSRGVRSVPTGAWMQLATLYDQIADVSEHALDTLDRDQLTPDALEAFALHEHGSVLPAPARDAAAAMFILTRLLDDE